MGDGPAIFILHGLYGMSDNWVTIAKELSTEFTVYLIDLRNHGRSPHCKEHDYESMCYDIKEIVEDEKLEKVILLGHSMGGKTAMLYTMMFPEDLAGLIVVDIAPVNYSSVDSYNHEVIMHLNIVHTLLSIDLTGFKSRVEIDDELEKNIKDSAVRQFLMKNVHRHHDGTFCWKFNIEAISNSLPKIMGFISEEKFAVQDYLKDMPVLFIKGGKSNYIIPDYYQVIKKAFPNAIIETISNTGHWVHAEQPMKFIQLVKAFLKPIS
jgi:pimeloyl-ACP methyl ester carboxylesterase